MKPLVLIALTALATPAFADSTFTQHAEQASIALVLIIGAVSLILARRRAA